MKKAIATPKAPAAIGPYSQGVAASGRFAFVSGQLPIDPATGAFAAEDIKGQTEQSLKNVGAILAEAGFGFEDVVKTTVLLADIADFGPMNEVYATFSPATARHAPPSPSRTCPRAPRSRSRP